MILLKSMTYAFLRAGSPWDLQKENIAVERKTAFARHKRRSGGWRLHKNADNARSLQKGLQRNP